MDDYSDYPMGDERTYQNKKKYGSPVHPNSNAAKAKRGLAKKVVGMNDIHGTQKDANRSADSFARTKPVAK